MNGQQQQEMASDNKLRELVQWTAAHRGEQREGQCHRLQAEDHHMHHQRHAAREIL
jgi:hypothetical protein